LLKASSPDDYPYYDELKEGRASAKRITDKINEAQRRAENRQIVRNLETRIEDWKGHHISNFGDLLLEDIFSVTKSDVDRDYHVFLFQRIILCCKELAPISSSAKKVSKNNSILKKQVPTPLQAPNTGGSRGKATTPLLLKGRIFLNNVTQATPKVSAGGFFC
jgi:cell division control protein 24